MTRPSLLLAGAGASAALALAGVLAAPAVAQVPAGAVYSETFIDTPDGERLHADVLRPAGLPEDAKTPVIAIVSPYLRHDEGRPNPRFNDLFTGAKVFERGYSVVQVDLRGSGGSSGCLDILGPGEQTDIKTAVEWAAEQPWSNGRVGMYGKSYDGNTGVAGASVRPKGLKAVVAQQVVGDRYSGSYSGGVRYLQSVAYPAVSYGSLAEANFTPDDSPEYISNSLAHSADCQAPLAEHYGNDPFTAFWRVRDFVERGQDSSVPLLMTTGFLDNNTNIGAKAIDFFNGLRGPKRLWLGWWDHVRGNDTVGERLAMGREGWFDEVVRFYDEHLKGERSDVRDPAVAVQGSDGTWREEAAWPPADVRQTAVALKTGSYTDDDRNLGSKDPGAGAGGQPVPGVSTLNGAGAWTISPPLERATQLAGIPQAAVKVTPLVPDTNLVVNLYDLDGDGKATMISRGARLVSSAGTAKLALYPTDWTFAEGHRIGILVSGSNAEAWIHRPTGTTVAVGGGSVSLPYLPSARSSDLPGEPAPRLERFRERAPFPVPAATITAAEDPAFPRP